MGPGTPSAYSIRTADRKEEEAVVISVEDLARTLLETDKFLGDSTRGAFDVPGIIPLLRDAKSGAELLRELGLNGSYYTKKINGQTYVILRGYAGLRKVLTGSRYLPTNPKVIAYGLTSAARAAGGAVNFVITFVVMVPMEIMSYVMDEQTLSQTFGDILAGTMVSALASAATFGAVAVGALALGAAVTLPAWVVVSGTIIVGIAINVGLQELGLKSTISGLVSMALDQAVLRVAEEEMRRAQGQRILGQHYHDNPGIRYSPWHGLLMGPRW
ncbi:hypothetical protein [Inquilinus limosus]|uniref:hypothetical protein n=1 Tax=Inquilinus limosus TaxID=171674 RepID=UPI00042101BE|nr:hypothetical protein [Inquilinus limosus]